jgi:hypothetical protein
MTKASDRTSSLLALLVIVPVLGTPCHGALPSYPLNNAVVNEYNPELSWIPNASFDRTQVQVATDVGFGSVVNDREIHHFVNRFVPLDSYATGDYWWRTRSRDEVTQTWGAWETGRKFTVADNPTVNINLADSYATIQNKINNSADNTRVVFEPGTYNFNSTDSGSDLYFLDLQYKSNLVVEGNGAEIIFDSSIGNLGFFRAHDSNDISLRNLTLQRDKKMGLAMKITEVNTAEDSFVVERLDSSYPLPSQDATQYNTTSAWTIDPANEKIKFGTTLSLLFDQDLSGAYGTDQWKYYLSSREYVADNLSPGDVILSGQKYGNRKEIDLLDSSNVTIYNFDTHNTGTTFHMLAGRTEGVKVLKSDWVRDGLHGPVSDGMHFKDARTGPWIEGNTIHSNGDDVIAIKPTNRTFTRVDDSTIELNITLPVEVGDVLQFFTDSAFNLTAEATVTDVNFLGSTKLITLDNAVVAETITSYNNYALAAPGTMISGNVFEGNRGDGFNIGVDGAIFEGNVIRDIGERVFLIHPSEGGGAQSKDVLITGNEFYNAKRFDDLSATTLGAFLNIKGQANKHAENIIVEDNVAYGYSNTAISLQQTDGVYIRNNTFSSGEYHDSADIPGDIVRLTDTQDVFIDSNQFIEFRNRPASENVDLSNAAGWAADNPNFDTQFISKVWAVDRVGHNETGSGITFGDPIPHRSLTAFSLTGSGTMSGGQGSDSSTFANVQADGDVDIKMKVLGLTEPAGTDFARGGVMIRESTDSNSAFVMMSVREFGGQWFLQHIYRDATGGALTAASTSDAFDFPIHVGLSRRGDTFASYYSMDGTTWNFFDSLSVPMNASTLTGVGVTSQGAGLLTTLLGDELLVDFATLGLFDSALIEGDLDDDGFVGIADLNIVLSNWNQNVPPANPLADPSGDGFVGIADLNVVLGNWNAGIPPSEPGASTNIPEPASVVLLGLTALSLLRRKA